MIAFDGDRVLMVERGREPLKGFWSLPGGCVETGETLVEAAAREMLEETGLVAEPVAIVEVFERIHRDAAGQVEYHYVLIDYLCRIAGGTLAAQDDASRAEWLPLADLASYRITEGTVPVIVKAFRIANEKHERGNSGI